MERSEAAVIVRRLTALEEFEEAVRLERETWGFPDLDVFPKGFFVIAAEAGGAAFGAFDGERMAGFCVGIPGVKPDGRVYVHSHMLATRPEYRDCGVGRALKLEQRRDALARGMRWIEWTFDPLERKNAWFNIERLGAVARRYIPNKYGETMSPLHGGLPTDRCVAEWALDSRWVTETLEGRRPRPVVEERVEVPAEKSRAEQAEVRERLQAAFGAGLAVIGFERPGTYLLGRWDCE